MARSPKSTTEEKKKTTTQEGTAPQDGSQAVQEGTAPQDGSQAVQEGTAPQDGSQPAQEGTTPPQDQQGPEKGKKQNPTVKAPNGVNLRIGPHKSFDRLTVLDNGAEVEILPLPGNVKVPGWSLVTTPDYTGWVDDSFLHIPEEA